jgi:GT2 family glycosyltransferase
VIRRIFKRVFPPGTKSHTLLKRHVGPLLLRGGHRPQLRADLSYAGWMRSVEPTTISPVIEHQYRPLISIIVPAYNTPDKYLNPLLDSILSQTYVNWELVLVEGSPDPERAAAIHSAAQRDERIRLIKTGENLGIAGNTNLGIEQAKGEFMALLDHDDTLAPFALNEIVADLQEHRDTDWFYSDEDKLSDDGRTRSLPLFKPEFSPDLLLGVNYVTHFCVVRSELMRRVGGIRTGFDGSQDYDLALRLMDEQPKVRRIDKILYHWRLAEGSTAVQPSMKNDADSAGQRALKDYVGRNHIAAEVVGLPEAPTNYRLKYATPGNPKASLIIPFKDKPDVTKVMIDSILAKTTYPNYEILLIDNRSTEPATAAYLATITSEPRVKAITYDEPFSWSAVNNFGRRKADGEVLVFLNNDMEVLSADWLAELVGVALQPATGAVGALLTYPTNPATIQHAGVVLGLFGVAGHVFRHLTTGNFTYFGLADWPRNYLAVTGACIAVTAAKFDQIKGFDERFQTAGSDVAFGIALHEAGYRNVYWPFAKLMHYENVSVGAYNERADTQNDYDESMKYYRPYLEGRDPYFNPNLELMDPQSERIMLKGTK